jgi:hypothetical protein
VVEGNPKLKVGGDRTPWPANHMARPVGHHLASKSPGPQRDGALKKEREKVLKKEEEKKKSSKTLQIKSGSQYFERRKTFQLQNLFM